jgi:hypothetical protein
MTYVNDITKSPDCLAGRMDAITYLKTQTLPRIIQLIEKRIGSKTNLDDLVYLSNTLENLPDFTNGVIKHGVVKELLEEEFSGCEETRGCVESYASNVPKGVYSGIYYDAYEQVLRTLVGMKVYLKTESVNKTIVNNINDKRRFIKYAAKMLNRYNTIDRIFDLSYAREALGNTIRETGHTKGSTKVAYELSVLIEKCRQILEESPEFSEDFADHMELISETALKTRQAREVIKIIRRIEKLINEAFVRTYSLTG